MAGLCFIKRSVHHVTDNQHYQRTKRIAIAPPVLEPSWREVREEQLLGYFKPTFSTEFIATLTDKLTDLLLERLRKKGDNVSVQMLNYIIMLTVFPFLIRKDGKVKGIADEEIVACVGELTYKHDIWSKGS